MGFDEDVADKLTELSEAASKRRLRKLMKNELEPCSGCGAQLHGGEVRCKIMFDDLCREIGKSTPDRKRALLLTTAAYFLQHPWKVKGHLSAVSHLGTIYYLLERKEESARNYKFSEWLRSESNALKIPPIPHARGDLTISSMYENGQALYSSQKIETWAKCVWDAYSEFHPIALRALQC